MKEVSRREEGFVLHLNKVNTQSEINFLKHFMGRKKTGTYIDVGTREQSHVVSSLWGPQKHFHLFEPQPEFYKMTCESHNSYENVKINNFGLGSKNELKDYYEKSQGFVNLPESWQSAPTYKLSLRTLDSYCKENGIDDIDFLKIDTEGFEKEVLLGGSDIIENGTKCIQFEYGSTWKDQDDPISIHEVMNTFFKEGWHMYILQPGLLLEFYPQHNPTLDIIMKFNYSNLIASRIDFKTGKSAHKNTVANMWKNIGQEYRAGYSDKS